MAALGDGRLEHSRHRAHAHGRLAERALRAEEQCRAAAVMKEVEEAHPTFRGATRDAVALLISSCSSRPSATSSEPARVPPLPLQAQPPPTPLCCLPVCVVALGAGRRAWCGSPESPAPPGLSVELVTTRRHASARSMACYAGW